MLHRATSLPLKGLASPFMDKESISKISQLFSALSREEEVIIQMFWEAAVDGADPMVPALCLLIEVWILSCSKSQEHFHWRLSKNSRQDISFLCWKDTIKSFKELPMNLTQQPLTEWNPVWQPMGEPGFKERRPLGNSREHPRRVSEHLLRHHISRKLIAFTFTHLGTQCFFSQCYWFPTNLLRSHSPFSLWGNESNRRCYHRKSNLRGREAREALRSILYFSNRNSLFWF